MEIQTPFIGITFSLEEDEMPSSITEFLQEITKGIELQKIVKNKILVVHGEQLDGFIRTVIYQYNEDKMTHNITIAVAPEYLDKICNRAKEALLSVGKGHGRLYLLFFFRWKFSGFSLFGVLSAKF